MNTGKKITGQLGLYLQWPLLLSIMIVVMNIAIAMIDTTAGLAMFGFTILYFLISMFLYVYKRKGIMAGLVEFSADYAWIQRKLLMDLHIPYAIVDESNCRQLSYGPTPSFRGSYRRKRERSRPLRPCFPM